MNTVIRCYTLFDITHTGVLNRSKPPLDMNMTEWVRKRNTQCNYDTILQVVSIRSQPEVIKVPTHTVAKLGDLSYFGSDFNTPKNTKFPYWTLDFSIQHAAVFNDTEDPIGALKNDCAGVPMILVGGEHPLLQNMLIISGASKNIHFEVL